MTIRIECALIDFAQLNRSAIYHTFLFNIFIKNAHLKAKSAELD